VAKLFITVLFLVVLTDIAVAQLTYKRQDKRFIYKVTVDSVLSADSANYNCIVRAVQIIRKSDHKTIQTIHPPESNFFWSMDKSVVFVVEDINFDGINDFRVLRSTGIGANELYYCWIFNRSTQQFQRNKLFERITSPEPDSKEKVIYSSWTGGWNDHGSSIYKWIKGQPVLIEENEVIQGGDDKNPTDTLITRKRIRGKMRLVARKIE
jgi:hypothetical protein